MTSADASGKWRIEVSPSQNFKMNVTFTVSGENGPSITIRDARFGDVIVCSGQSNMVFAMAGIDNATAQINLATKYPNIRIFHIPTLEANTSTEKLPTDLSWQVCVRKI